MHDLPFFSNLKLPNIIQAVPSVNLDCPVKFDKTRKNLINLSHEGKNLVEIYYTVQHV